METVPARDRDEQTLAESGERSGMCREAHAAEMRVALDGHSYPYVEFESHYGADAARRWGLAPESGDYS